MMTRVMDELMQMQVITYFKNMNLYEYNHRIQDIISKENKDQGVSQNIQFLVLI